MTEDVLTWGDDRPRRRSGSVVAGVAAVLLLGAGIAGALRSPGSPRPSASPTPSSSIGLPGYPMEDDPFARFVTHRRPEPDAPTSFLLPGGVPAWLVDEGGVVKAYEAIGGPPHARVLLGWCSDDRTFQDVNEIYSYVGVAPAKGGGDPLAQHAVRARPDDPAFVDVGVGTVPIVIDLITTDDGCPSPLEYPALPGIASFLGSTATGYGRMNGRYVVTHETRAFCPADDTSGCATAGWEQYGGRSVLPPGDLAASYTWEGEFLVHAESATGDLHVVITHGARLVRREKVGVKVRVGWAESSYDRGGVLHLRFNAFRPNSGSPPDDSPTGPPFPVEGWAQLFTDEKGGLRDYAVAPDAEVHLGLVTGLGRPQGTPAVLRTYLGQYQGYVRAPLWLVFDARGRVMRVVQDRNQPG